VVYRRRERDGAGAGALELSVLRWIREWSDQLAARHLHIVTNTRKMDQQRVRLKCGPVECGQSATDVVAGGVDQPDQRSESAVGFLVARLYLLGLWSAGMHTGERLVPVVERRRHNRRPVDAGAGILGSICKSEDKVEFHRPGQLSRLCGPCDHRRAGEASDDHECGGRVQIHPTELDADRFEQFVRALRGMAGDEFGRGGLAHDGDECEPDESDRHQWAFGDDDLLLRVYTVDTNDMYIASVNETTPPPRS